MSKLVFFVDDDKMILNLLEYTFSGRDGIQVKTFYTGEDCLENIGLNPDLIILDHNLSKGDDSIMSGLETLQKMPDKGTRSKVIMLSGQDDEELVNEFLLSGAKKYIAKDSYFIDTLIQTIEDEIAN